MSNKILLIPLMAASVLTACFDGNSNYSADDAELDFDEFLLELVDPARVSMEPAQITDKRFRFPQNQAAFADLFLTEQ